MTYEEQLIEATPAHLEDQARYVAQTVRNIDRCDQREVARKLELADRLGLRVDLPNQFTIVVHKSSKKDERGNWTETYSPTGVIGWVGVIRMAMRSGKYQTVAAHLVHESDLFECDLAQGILSHRPTMWGHPGECLGVYAFALDQNGRYEIERMTTAEIDTIKESVRFWQKGPWATHWGEMARKTVLKRLGKRLEFSAEDQRVLKEEDDETEWIRPALVDVTPQRKALPATEEPKPAPPTYADDAAIAEAKRAIASLESLGAERSHAIDALTRHHGEGTRTVESIRDAVAAAHREMSGVDLLETQLRDAGDDWAAWIVVLAAESGQSVEYVQDAMRQLHGDKTPTIDMAMDVASELFG